MNTFFKSYLTSIVGSVAGGPMIYASLTGDAGVDVTMLLAGIGMLLTGLFAKDGDKSTEDVTKP